MRLTDFLTLLGPGGCATACFLFFDFLLRFDGYIAVGEMRIDDAPSHSGPPSIHVVDMEAKTGRARGVVAAGCANAPTSAASVLYRRASRRDGLEGRNRVVDFSRLSAKLCQRNERIKLTPRLDLIADRRIDFARAKIDGALLRLQDAEEQPSLTLRQALTRARRLRLCERFRLDFSESGHPRAALGWGWMDDRAMGRLQRLGLNALHWSELGEGDVPCFVDAMGDPVSIAKMKTDLREGLSKEGYRPAVDMISIPASR